MLLSAEDLCSDHQALSASAVSENIIDVGVQRAIIDDRLHFFVKVDDFAGGTSIKAEVQTSADNETFATIADTGAVVVANIPENGIILDVAIPQDRRGSRYWRVNYTLAGTFSTAPVVTAGFVDRGGPINAKEIPVA